MTITVLPHRDELGVGPGKMFIGGRWVEAHDGGTWSHVHPSTNEVVTTMVVVPKPTPTPTEPLPRSQFGCPEKVP